MKIKGSSKVVRIFLIVLWAIALGAVYFIFLRYSVASERNSGADIQTNWIQKYTSIGRPTLFFFLHPKCSCSLASLTELENILRENVSYIKVIGVVSVRSAVDQEFMNSESVLRMKELKDIEMYYDIGSTETRNLGISTSGHVLFYDQVGELRYTGGITSSRGHVGDSIGKFELSNRLKEIYSEQKFVADVYGCGFGSKVWK